MEIYLLRHAIAEESAPSGRDSDRQLTEQGRVKLRRVMDRARKAGVKPSLILTSPYRRAVETAEIASQKLAYEGEILHTESLIPSSTPPRIWSELRGHRSESAILLAGHEPVFSATVAWMLGSTRMMVNFRKAALVRIDVEGLGAEPKGVLQWMLTAGTT